MLAEIIDKNTIYVYDLTQFDPDAIMHSGQVFRYFDGSDAGSNIYNINAGAADKTYSIHNTDDKTYSIHNTDDKIYSFHNSDDKIYSFHNSDVRCCVYRLIAGSNYAEIYKASLSKPFDQAYKNIADAYANVNITEITGKHNADIKKQHENKTIIKCSDSEYFFNYFDLQTDYNQIKKELSHLSKFKNAIKAGGGIRILRAEFAETVISFIISANNNIKRFTKTLNLLAEKYGAKQSININAINTINTINTISNSKTSGMNSKNKQSCSEDNSNSNNKNSCESSGINEGQHKIFFAFPTLNQLSAVTEQGFKDIGCGYRSGYLVKAVKQLQALNFDELNKLPDDLLKKELLKIQGVGPKVCSCIMLFCFHRLNTAPVDTWITKALNQLNDGEQKAIFGNKYAGVAQQYIFYYMQYLHKELAACDK